MLIKKVHGLSATRISLDDRFTMIAALGSQQRRITRQQWQVPANSFNKFALQAKRTSHPQRLGTNQGTLRRTGSETNLTKLRRSNSFGNLSQAGVRNKHNWRGSNTNLSRSASFGNLSQVGLMMRRGLNQRGVNRTFRGRGRGRGVEQRIGRSGRGARVGTAMAKGGVRSRQPVGGRGMRGTRGRGRGAIQRQTPEEKKVPTKEELDQELDQYMAMSKSALDRELDQYMECAWAIDL